MAPSPGNASVHLKPRVNEPHPWFGRDVVEDASPKPRNGEIVEVKNARGKWVGRGFYNGHARIRVRVLTRDPQENIDAAFFYRRIAAAVGWRNQLGLLSSTHSVSDACRLVHSEGDDLSGLIVDRYRNILVVQFVSAGMFQRRQEIVAALRESLKFLSPEPFEFYLFADKRVQKQESFDCPETAGYEIVITENKIRYHVTIGSKHKTGFFVDQRENRKKFASLSAGKQVLDLCCHTGGFSLASAAAGAETVTGVDLDDDSIETAQKNAVINNLDPSSINFVASDLFKWPTSQRYDLVVLDPAKQTRSEEGTPEALRRYFDMNCRAMSLLNPGGTLLTCSCSGRISEKEFINAVREAAFATKKTLQVFDVTGAAPDHPFLLHVPESRYLKAVWARLV
jgi:23S rRNA (cytosine1962-C5)-methyltransferase